MMRIHLHSIREFHPEAPILISKRGGNAEEMERYRAEFRVRYWLEDCDYIGSLLRLFQRCETQYVCALDHDTVLLSSIAPLIQEIHEDRFDLVGVEERIRELPESGDSQASYNGKGWLRFAPGQVASNFILFNLRSFRRRWGLAGVKGKRIFDCKDYEYDYGIGQRLRRHKYLRPYGTKKYGLGNLLMDGEQPILWHQWYGAHSERLASTDDVSTIAKMIQRGESRFIADYPNLDFSDLSPAWAPGCDVESECKSFVRNGTRNSNRNFSRFRSLRQLRLAEFIERCRTRFDRWRVCYLWRIWPPHPPSA